MNVLAPPVPKVKPRLRGVSHQISFFVSLAAAAALVAWARPGAPRAAAAVFGASVALLFGTSALYHRVHWQPLGRERMRRLDHAAIFVLIAGGYTPLLAALPLPGGGYLPLCAIWGGAALGVVKSLVWPNAPKWIIAALCVVLGWTGIGEVMKRAGILGATTVGLIVASGLVYSAGALVYARRRPDPVPAVFGYHEVFHALVVVATCFLYAHAARVLRLA